MPDTPYFTPAELRALYTDVADATAYPDVLMNQYRALAEQAFEDAAGVAFVPRTVTEALRSPNGGVLRASHPRVRSVTAATDAVGATISLTTLQVDGSWLTVDNGWPLNLGAVTVTYTHGYDSPPLRVKQAVMALAREWMLSGPVTDRQTGIPVEGGGTISLARPGGRFGTFGLAEVDAAVEQYGLQTYVG